MCRGHMLNDSARTWYGRINQHALSGSNSMLVNSRLCQVPSGWFSQVSHDVAISAGHSVSVIASVCIGGTHMVQHAVALDRTATATLIVVVP